MGNNISQPSELDLAIKIDENLAYIANKTNEVESKVDGNILRSIASFEKYIQYLTTIKNDYLIIIVAKDTPGNYLKKDLMPLGCMDLTINFQLSYAVIINEGKIAYEKLSKNRLDPNDFISHKEKIGNCTISLLSKGYLIGNVAEIILNGNDYSRNIRGLNFVVFNKRTNDCIDSVSFDTHLAEKTCYREAIINSSMSYFLGMKEKITKSIETIKNINITQQDIFFDSLKKEDQNVFDVKKDFFLLLPKIEELSVIQKGVLFIMRLIDDICRKNNIDYWLMSGNLLGAVRHKGQIPWDDDFDISMMRNDFYKFCDIIDNKELYPDIYLNRYCCSHRDKLRGFFYRVEIGDAALSGKRCFVDIFPYVFIDEVDDERIKAYDNIRNNFTETKMGSFRYRWESIRHDRIAFNNQWRTDLEEVDKIYDAVCNTSKKPKALILSPTNKEWDKYILDVGDVLPVIDVQYDGLILKAPKNPLNVLQRNYSGDIYYMPNDIIGHSHINLGEKEVNELNVFIDKMKQQLGWK